MINRRKILLLFGDIVLIYFSLFLALAIRFWNDFNWQIFKEHLFPFSLLYLFWLIIFYALGFYDFDLFKNSFIFFSKIFVGIIFSLIFGIILFYFLPFFGITPKTILFLNILFLGILIISWRKFFYSFFSSYFQKKVAILGKNIHVKELISTIQENPHLGYKFVSFLNPKKNILEQIKKENIDTLILAEKLLPNSPLIKKLYQDFLLRLDFIDLDHAYEIILEKVPVGFINQVWFLENLKEKEKNFYESLKRIIDIFLALLIIILTSFLWPLIALAIKLEDKGPIFYIQERVGKDRKIFKLIKFRSMVKEAEKEGPQWAEKDDKRVTKIGKILRKTHLDELPQLINILKEDISFVGPRPERPEFVEQLEKEIPYYHLRHIVKPGLTGWAQIKFRYGRSIEDSLEKFQYDLYYIKNRSLFLDLRILLKTFQLFFKKE